MSEDDIPTTDPNDPTLAPQCYEVVGTADACVKENRNGRVGRGEAFA